MTPEGQYVKKTIVADSRSDLKWRLEKDGHFVYRIKREDRFRLTLGGEPHAKRFKLRDFFSFNKEFAVLIRTGMPIVAATMSPRVKLYRMPSLNIPAIFRTCTSPLCRPAKRAVIFPRH